MDVDAGGSAEVAGGAWPTEAFVATRHFGAARVDVLSDGGFTWAPELRAPEEEWRRAMPEANARGEIFLGHNMVLIRHGGVAALVDAGLDDPSPVSPWMPPKARRSPGVQAGLARLGLAPEDVTHVVLTHAHGDHVAGSAVERDGRRVPRYPRARYLLGRRDWEGHAALAAPDPLIGQHLGALHRAGALDLIDGETVLAPGIVLEPSPGDSPGHYLVRLDAGDNRLYVVGDLFHHACEVQHPDWVSPGRDPVSSLASRRRLMAAAAGSGATVVFSHEHFPPWGRISSREEGYHWQRDEAEAPGPAQGRGGRRAGMLTPPRVARCAPPPPRSVAALPRPGRGPRVGPAGRAKPGAPAPTPAHPGWPVPPLQGAPGSGVCGPAW